MTDARARVLDALRRGLSRAAACRDADVARRSFYRWLADPTFAAAVTQAESDYWARVTAENEALYAPPTPPSTTVTVEEHRPDGSLVRRRVVPKSLVEITMEAAQSFPDADSPRGRARGHAHARARGPVEKRPRNGL